MRLSDLRDKKVRTVDGESVGRVHEVHCDRGKLVALVCGAPSFIERLTAKARGRRVPWSEVLRVDEDGVVIGPIKPADSHPRRGKGRPSARR